MTDSRGRIREALETLSSVAATTAGTDLTQVEAYVHRVVGCLRRGGKILFCGNGGSAADAQHLAAEYVVRLNVDRQGMSAMALTTDTSVLTATANDRGYDEVFARQIRALGRSGDLLVLHSTSGNSQNLLRAAEAARDVGMETVALLARGGGGLRSLVDVAIVVPTDQTSHAQELHLALGHAVCAEVERALFAQSDSPTEAEEGRRWFGHRSAPPSTGAEALVPLLEELRAYERGQTVFYRWLAAEAEAAGKASLSERLNGLHADEQHHLSRLTARLLELGHDPERLGESARPQTPLVGWEQVARVRERREIERYEAALPRVVGDAETRAIVEEILESERQHEVHLGGKWMPA